MHQTCTTGPSSAALPDPKVTSLRDPSSGQKWKTPRGLTGFHQQGWVSAGFPTTGTSVLPRPRNGILVCASLQKKSSFRSRSFVFQVHQYFLVVLYDRTIILPPGIRNEGNICYAISVVQCLFNHSTFRDSLAEVCAFHEEDGQCEMCLQKGMVLSSKNEVINT